MTTIKFLIQVIDNASASFRDVAKSANDLGRDLDKLKDRAKLLDKQFRDTAAGMRLLENSTERLGNKFTTVREKANLLGIQFTATKNQAKDLGVWLGRAADRANELAREMFLLGRETSDLRDSTVRLAGAMDGLRATTLDADAALAKLVIAANAAGDAMTRLAIKTAAAGAAATGTRRAFFGLWGILGLLRGQVILFGGLLGDTGLGVVKRWHLVLDLFADLGIVLVEAAAAMAAFAFAASDAVRQVIHHVQNAHIAMDAFGKSIAPATGAMEKLHAAVTPTVYQAFGDALLVMKNRSGAFSQVTMQTAGAVRTLMNRLTAGILASHGLDKFAANASKDFLLLGEFVGNLFGILGALFRAMPGYAEILLAFLVQVSRLVEIAIQVAEPVLKVALALHGLWLYGGLAISIILKLGRAIIFLAVEAIPGAITGLTEMIALLVDNPLFWIGAAIAGIVALTVWIVKSKDATQTWFAEIESGIHAANAIHGLTLLTQGQKLATDRVAASTRAYNKVVGETAQMERLGGRATQWANAQRGAAQSNLNETLAGQKQLNTESGVYNTKLAALTKHFGSASLAQHFLALSGVSMNDMLSTQKGALGKVLLEVDATAAGYAAMGEKGGVLGNTIDVMDRQLSDQYQAIQKVNTAWDTFIGNMTAAQGSFDTVAQGVETLAGAFKKAGGAGQTITLTLGKLKTKFEETKTGIDSLTKSGVALNQAFTTQIGNLNTMFDSWRQAGIGQKLFIEGVKASLQPMLKYAKGSQEATAQLVGLAQEAGYKGPASLRALTSWLGKTHDAMKLVKGISNQATVQMGLLTAAMNSQQKMIAHQLLAQLDAMELRYSKLPGLINAYAQADAQQGPGSSAAHQRMQAAIKGIEDYGKMHDWTKLQIAAMISQLFKIPLKRSLQIVMTGDGSFTIGELAKHGGAPIGGGNRIRQAAGGFVSGAGGPMDDMIPAMLSNGEYVVRAASVNSYGTDLLDAINMGAFSRGGLVRGYAEGGPVLQGNKDVLSGKAATDFSNRFQNVMETAMVNSMNAALIAAEKAASGSGEAIFNYAKKIGTGHPYVWGGTGPASYDCSGLTQAAYTHFGYPAPRTSEAQQVWAKPSKDQAGALVFFYGRNGTASHVGISGGNGQMFNAMSPAAGIGMAGSGGNSGFGIPPGGFHNKGAMGGVPGGGTAQEYVRSQAAAKYLWTGIQWQDLFNIIQAESSWRLHAHNPTSSAAGLFQLLQGGLGSLQQQTVNGLRYISSRYGNPENAWAFHRAHGWYKDGGPVRRMAGGGSSSGKGGGENAIHRLFDYWMKHFAGFRQAHPNIYADLHGKKLFEYFVKHWPVWIKDNMHRVTGGGGGNGGGGSGGSGGKSKGPTDSAVEAMIKVFNHGSLASMISEIHTFLADIKKQFGGGGARERQVKAQLDHLKNIRDQLSHLNAKIAAAKQYAQSVTSGLQSYSDIGSMTVGGGYIGSQYESGGQMLHFQLQQKLANLRKFAKALKQLAKHHVPAEIMREIINAGPDAGLQIAQEILAGGPELMKQLAGDEAALQKVEKQIGQGSASYIYTGQFRTGKDFIKGLQHEQKRLEKLFQRLGRVLGEEAAKWFGVKDHFHGGHHHHGGHHEKPPHIVHHRGHLMHPGGGAVVNIAPGGTVNIREPVDMKILNQQIDFGLFSAGLGG